ncbi:MAG: hypothetical protein KDK99_04320 [Verrucomicrobiales bacterium]|nr:hypothetical protein [Verrucomicrobiales bacterium]
MKKTAPYLAVFGAASQTLIPIGIVVLQMKFQAAVAKIDLSGASDPKHVISITNATISQMRSASDFLFWIFGCALVALTLFIVSITRLRYRRKWAFWFACIYGGCLTCIVPLGTPFGLFLLVYALIHRQEFVPSASVPTTLTA